MGPCAPVLVCVGRLIVCCGEGAEGVQRHAVMLSREKNVVESVCRDGNNSSQEAHAPTLQERARGGKMTLDGRKSRKKLHHAVTV